MRKLLILSIIVAAGFSFADDAVLFGNVLETDLILTPEGVTNAILITALTAESDPLAYAPATNALALASTALQPGATNGLLRAEADTLATVTARGATTTKEITAANFIGGRYGAGAGVNAYGNEWGAYGANAGSFVNGNEWSAYGYTAGFNASGNAWGAYGRMAGYGADHNNSHAFGQYAGYAARGDSRLYIDVYAADPRYAADGAINDRIFGDTDGKLYLGRGEGAPGGAVGGTLRGPWTGGGFASYHDATNIAVAAVEAAIPDASAISRSVSNATHNVATSLIGHPYVLQGSIVVPASNAMLTVSGVASNGVGGAIHLMPRLETRPSEAGSTGTLHIATAPDTYIVDVSGDMHVTPPDPEGMVTPRTYNPVEWRSKRVDETNWIIYAWAPGDPQTYDPLPGAGYYATLSNLVVSTYNRPGYYPGTLTNDTAALPTYTDTVDISRADGRRVATAGGIRDYVAREAPGISRNAWRYTPRGYVAPSAETVTIDMPLVQQGQIAYLQSGDYFVLSYDGGDWVSSSTGSVWQIGASGRKDFTITSEGRMGHIRDFAVDTSAQIATIYASTNWMVSGQTPYLEFAEDLSNPQWLACQNCVESYHVDAVNGDYWTFVAPATLDKCFYRVVIPGGERRIISTPTHRFEGGVEFGGVIYNIITITNGTERYEVLGRRL